MFDPYVDILDRLPVWPTVGNHDEIASSSDAETGPFHEIFTLPELGEIGGVASGREANYSFTRGPVHFSVVNTELDVKPDSPMLSWLAADLAAATTPWKIA